jgi:hypothetical protein
MSKRQGRSGRTKILTLFSGLFPAVFCVWTLAGILKMGGGCEMKDFAVLCWLTLELVFMSTFLVALFLAVTCGPMLLLGYIVYRCIHG